MSQHAIENPLFQRIYTLKKGGDARGQAVELGDLKVSKIVIRGNNSNYCMYGYQPGDSWESMYPGMQEGGSGEWTDPQGNVFSMYSSTDPSSPQIELLDPSFW